jgi:hypothetical protein
MLFFVMSFGVSLFLSLQYPGPKFQNISCPSSIVFVATSTATFFGILGSASFGFLSLGLNVSISFLLHTLMLYSLAFAGKN